MRYAVLTDIHGNLEALTAVLDRIARIGADAILCLGDIVGYNANPGECIDIVRSEHMVCLLGNHDSAVCGLSEPDTFSPLARQAVLWTRARLAPQEKAFLLGLPRELAMPDLFLCHGAIHDTDRYLLHPDDLRETISLLTGLPGSPSICFHGHTHLQTAVSAQGDTLRREPNDGLRLDRSRHYLINPGAVGQPRDGDPRAAFLIYDSEERRVTFHRAGYDIDACQDKIIRAGLPPRLAERLVVGR